MKDIRVLELAMGWAGPLACMLLADFGAEVIKVESTRHMDWWRGSDPGSGPEERPYERAAMYNGVNRNKYGCTLDLTDPRGMGHLRSLISISDVMVENFTPRVMENFGLTYEAVRAINPSLIMVSMPAFGMTGPWRDYAGYGSSMASLSGITGLTGYPDGPPILTSNAYGDPVNGLGGAIAVLMALVRRRATGLGQHIEISHQEMVVHHVAQTLTDYAMNGRDRGRQGNRHAWMGPQGVYPCLGEDEWIAISVASDEEWVSLCAVLELPNAGDDRFADGLSRWRHQDDLDALLSRSTARWGKRELAERLRWAGVAGLPVNSSADVLDEPQVKAQCSFVWMDRQHVGRHPYPGVTARLSGTPGSVRTPAPTLGEHNQLVLSEVLGLEQGDIEALERDQVIGNQPTFH